MVIKNKNAETEAAEIGTTKRVTRKSSSKKSENADMNLSVASSHEFASDLENNNAKNDVVSQTNPGRFTAEMLIAMGKQLEEKGSVESCEIVEKEERGELDESTDDIEGEELVFVQSFEKPMVKNDVDECDEDIAGREFEYRDMNFIALEESSGGILAISSEILERRMRFAENDERGSNDWRKSSLRKKLNNEYVQKFNKNDLMPIVSDLTADTGENNYGKSEDYIAIPSDNMFRKFHKIIPTYPSWVWSLTPWAINYGTISAVGARTNAKTIYSEQVNHELGVAIVCRFKKDIVCWC